MPFDTRGQVDAREAIKEILELTTKISNDPSLLITDRKSSSANDLGKPTHNTKPAPSQWADPFAMEDLDEDDEELSPSTVDKDLKASIDRLNALFAKEVNTDEKVKAIQEGFQQYCRNQEIDREDMLDQIKNFFAIVKSNEHLIEPSVFQSLQKAFEKEPLFTSVFFEKEIKACLSYRDELNPKNDKGSELIKERVEQILYAARGDHGGGSIEGIREKMEIALKDSKKVFSQYANNRLTRFLSAFGPLGQWIINSNLYQGFFAPKKEAAISQSIEEKRPKKKQKTKR